MGLQLYRGNVLRHFQIEDGFGDLHVHLDIREFNDHVVAAGFGELALNRNPPLMVHPQADIRKKRRDLGRFGFQFKDAGLLPVDHFLTHDGSIVKLPDILVRLSETDQKKLRLVLVLSEEVFLNLFEFWKEEKRLSLVDQHPLLFRLRDIDLDPRILPSSGEIHAAAVHDLVINDDRDLGALHIRLHGSEVFAVLLHLRQNLVEGVGALRL